MAHSDRPSSSGPRPDSADAGEGQPKVRPGRKAARAAEAKAKAERGSKAPQRRDGGESRPGPGRGPRGDGPRREGPRGGPRGADTRDARSDTPDDEKPRKIGEPRNEHGTRTARRVKCTRCGKVDHVPGGPRDKDKVMCRSCLEEVMELFEVGVRNKRATRPVDCTVCGKHFDLPLTVDVDDEEVCCFDCMRGFTTWQGSVNKPETRSQPTEERRPGVRLRSKAAASSSAPPAPAAVSSSAPSAPAADDVEG